ncbi:MAG: hypothetical protein WDN26_08220 [Chitinophagaceae bacterium]
MQAYINQLLADITYATENVSLLFVEKELQLQDWITDEEENKTAPIRNLQEWSGISEEMLPPQEKLNDEQVNKVLTALKQMLDAYNCSSFWQTEVPDRIQYAAIRSNFNQPVKVKRWHMGFFELCVPGTEHKKCALGDYCQCAFFKEFFSGFIDEELSPHEERVRELEIEVKHIKKNMERIG